MLPLLETFYNLFLWIPFNSFLLPVFRDRTEIVWKTACYTADFKLINYVCIARCSRWNLKPFFSTYQWRFCEEIFLIPKNLAPFFRYLWLFFSTSLVFYLRSLRMKFRILSIFTSFFVSWRFPLYASHCTFYYLSLNLISSS